MAATDAVMRCANAVDRHVDEAARLSCQSILLSCVDAVWTSTEAYKISRQIVLEVRGDRNPRFVRARFGAPLRSIQLGMWFFFAITFASE